MNISEVMPNGNVRVVIPIQLRKTGRGRVIVRRENTQAVQSQISLLKSIANGIQWQQWLDDGLFKNVQESTPESTAFWVSKVGWGDGM